MGAIGLTIQQLRANAFNTYAKALDNIGLPTEKTTVWILNLPIYFFTMEICTIDTQYPTG